MPQADKPLAWLHGEIKTPPFSTEARIEAGVLLASPATRRERSASALASHAEHRQGLS
jgi:hypothetical protein